MWKQYNPSPVGRNVGDCSVRAISAALGVDWGTAYALLAKNGFEMGDVMNSNGVIGSVLRQHGFVREAIPNSCPDCFTIADFCREHPKGVYVLGTGTHVVAVIDGEYYDSWNSGREIPQYYWRKE